MIYDLIMRFKHKFIEKPLEIILMNKLKDYTLICKSRTNTIRPKKHGVRPKIYCIGQRDYKTNINNVKFAL